MNMRGLFPQRIRGGLLDPNLIDKVQSFPPAHNKETGRIDANAASKSIDLLKLEQLAQSPMLQGVSAEELDKFFRYIDNAASRFSSNITLEGLRYAIRESFSLPHRENSRRTISLSNLEGRDLVEEKIRSLLNIFDYVYKNAAKPDDLIKDTFLNKERHLVNLNRGRRGAALLVKGLKADLESYFRRSGGFFTEGAKSQILELAKDYAAQNIDLSKKAISNPPNKEEKEAFIKRKQLELIVSSPAFLADADFAKAVIESFNEFKSTFSDPFDDAFMQGNFAAYENRNELINAFLDGLEKLLEIKTSWTKDFEQNYLNNLGNALEIIAKKYPGCKSKASDLRINIHQVLKV